MIEIIWKDNDLIGGFKLGDLKERSCKFGLLSEYLALILLYENMSYSLPLRVKVIMRL